MFFNSLAFTLSVLGLAHGATLPQVRGAVFPQLDSGHYTIINKASNQTLVSFGFHDPIGMRTANDTRESYPEWFVLRVGLLEYKIYNERLRAAAVLKGDDVFTDELETGKEATTFTIRDSGNQTFAIENYPFDFSGNGYHGVWTNKAGSSQLQMEEPGGVDSQHWKFVQS